MATLSPTQRRPSAAPRARVPARVRRLTPPPRTRLKQRLADARAHEVRARRELTLALARAEQTYELAVRNLEQFDEYLDSVRARLHQADCLAAARGRGRSNLL